MRTLTLIATAMLLACVSAAAQDAGDPPADSVPSQEAAPATPVTAPATDPVAGGYQAGLPERPAPPRTLRAHWHVFVAFAIVWLLLFGYALSVGRRFGRLEDEVRRLGGPAG